MTDLSSTMLEAKLLDSNLALASRVQKVCGVGSELIQNRLYTVAISGCDDALSHIFFLGVDLLRVARECIERGSEQ